MCTHGGDDAYTHECAPGHTLAIMAERACINVHPDDRVERRRQERWREEKGSGGAEGRLAGGTPVLSLPSPYRALGPSLPEAEGAGGEAEGGGSQHHHRVAPETTADPGQECRGQVPGEPGRAARLF